MELEQVVNDNGNFHFKVKMMIASCQINERTNNKQTTESASLAVSFLSDDFEFSVSPTVYLLLVLSFFLTHIPEGLNKSLLLGTLLLLVLLKEITG